MEDRRYLNGDTCPACHGKNHVLMERDAHRSGGQIPCHFSTEREGTFNGGVPLKMVDLKCVGGKLTRQYSVPEPERTIMDANDEVSHQRRLTS